MSVLTPAAHRAISRRRLRSWLGRAPKVVLSLLLLSVLCWWFASEARLTNSAGKVFTFGALTLQLPLGGPPVEIGRDALMQVAAADSAEARHVRIEYTTAPDGTPHVYLHDIATRRRLLLTLSNDESGDADRWAIAPRDKTSVAIGPTTIEFSAVSAPSAAVAGFHLTIHSSTPSARPRQYDVRLGRLGDGLAVVPVPGEGSSVHPPDCRATALEWLEGEPRNLWDRFWPDTRQIVTIGGDGSCREPTFWQVAAPALDWRELSVSFSRRDRRFYIQASDPASRNDRLIAFTDSHGETAGFNGIRWQLDAGADGHQTHVTGFVAGRSSYTIATHISASGTRRVASVTIRPVAGRRQPLYGADAQHCGWLLAGTMPPGEPAGSAAACPALIPSGVSVSPPFALFDRYLDGSTTVLSGAERMLRWAMLCIAIALVALLTMRPAAFREFAQLQRRTGGRRAWLVLLYKLLPFVLTAASALIAVLPEVASLHGLSFGADGARGVMLLNWFLAGIALIWFGESSLLGVFWIVVAVIAGIGSISMTSLALDGGSTYWVGFIAKHQLVFLDIVPPFIVAAATVPMAVIRPVLQELVVGNRRAYRFVRWLPIAALVLAFTLWSFAGDQQGVGGFQPVEAGKFVALLLIGVPLAGFAEAARKLAMRRRPPNLVLSIVVLGIFLALLFTPLLRGDFSPFLIVFLVTVLLILLHFLPSSVHMLGDMMRVGDARRRVPLRFLPRPKKGKWDHVLHKGIPASIVLIVVGGSIAMFFAGRVVAYELDMHPAAWPHGRAATLERLEDALGRGRRLVPVQRFITWYDLDYAADATTLSGQRPFAEFRDLDLQVIRSRIVVAHAPCESPRFFPAEQPGDGGGMAAWLASGFIDVVMHGEDLLGPWFRHADICTPMAGVGSVSGTMSGLSREAARRRLIDDVTPLHIPVVQSDFAAAYLIGRQGLEAAGLLMAAQALLLLLIARGYLTLADSRDGESAARIVRDLLSVLLAGAGLLFALHWTIAWANVLGLLPVMGQPMTFLAAGTSHHLGMALPCLLTIVVAFRYAAQRDKILPLRSPPPRW